MTARPPLRLLLVDNDHGYRITSAALLEDEGFFVETAASFAEGKRRLRSGEYFDLVILDYNLGDGSGSDLIPLARAAMPSTKVVLISGMRPPPPHPALDGTITKGGDFRQVVKLLQRLLA